MREEWQRVMSAGAAGADEGEIDLALVKARLQHYLELPQSVFDQIVDDPLVTDQEMYQERAAQEAVISEALKATGATAPYPRDIIKQWLAELEPDQVGLQAGLPASSAKGMVVLPLSRLHKMDLLSDREEPHNIILHSPLVHEARHIRMEHQPPIPRIDDGNREGILASLISFFGGEKELKRMLPSFPGGDQILEQLFPDDADGSEGDRKVEDSMHDPDDVDGSGPVNGLS